MRTKKRDRIRLARFLILPNSAARGIPALYSAYAQTLPPHLAQSASPKVGSISAHATFKPSTYIAGFSPITDAYASSHDRAFVTAWSTPGIGCSARKAREVLRASFRRHWHFRQKPPRIIVYRQVLVSTDELTILASRYLRCRATPRNMMIFIAPCGAAKLCVIMPRAACMSAPMYHHHNKSPAPAIVDCGLYSAT